MEKRILICDDDENILDVTGLLLESYGYKVLLEQNSSKLLNRIRKENPDLLLIDIRMPLMMGDDIVRLLRKDEHTSKLPIIMFSASLESKRIAFEAGANDYIAKPFDIDHLEKKIRVLSA